MLYVLLTIIAVGVLLASKPGQKLLVWIIGGLIGAALLYALFWLVILAIGVMSEKETRDVVVSVMGIIVLAFGACYWIYDTYKKFKSGEYSIRKGYNTTISGIKAHYIVTIFLVLSFAFIIYTFIKYS